MMYFTLRPLFYPLCVVFLMGAVSLANAQVQLRALPRHPRILATELRFAELRRQNDSVSVQIKSLIRQEADHILTTGPTNYPTTGFLMGPMRQVQGRVITLAMAYRLTDDLRYANRARQELRRLADLSNWGTNHFLDVGEAALAAGLGLDWLHDQLSTDELNHLAKAIATRALEPSLNVQEGVNGWVDGDYNWNQVCNAGLSVGALAIAEQYPDLAGKIINRAIRNVPKAGAVYAPDGSYPEGPSYWSYGTSFHVILIEALRSSVGTSYGLEKLPGFLKTADYNLQMVAPGGLDFNYSDYHLENLNEPIMLWFARELRRGELATTELADLKRLSQPAETKTGSQPILHASRHVPLELLWWDPGLPASNQALPLHWTSSGVLPLAVMRSSWNDPRATFVAVKGGTPNHSHAHMDVGSFILEADGVRWAIDPGTESYDKMRAAKLSLWSYSQNSTRWSTFRVGPEAHNILRFDGAPQDITGKADISSIPSRKGTVGNVINLTTLYRNQVLSAERSIRLNADRSVVIEDRWIAGNQQQAARLLDISWQWLTYADVTQTPTGLLLRQNGQSLQLTVENKAETTIVVEDVSVARNGQDSPNPGLSRIVIKRQTAANAKGSIRVKAIPGSNR